MRILYVHQHFTTPKGASGTRSYEFAKHLIKKGHKVTILCGSYSLSKTGLTGKFKKGIRCGTVDGINIVEINIPYSNKLNFLSRIIRFFKFSFIGSIICWRYQYDILFATSTPLTVAIPGIILKLIRRDKRPFILEIRDLWPDLPRAMGVIKNPIVLRIIDYLESISYKVSDACVALSPGIKKGIEKKADKNKKIKLIPNGCDVEFFQKKSGIHSVDIPIGLTEILQENFVAIFPGAHGLANGLDILLDVAVELKRLNTKNIKIVLIGDGMCKKNLQERAVALRLDNCIFYPPVEKVILREILGGCDVGLQVLKNVDAFYEGTSPNKFFDFLSAGLPVLNNYPGWVAELIRKNQCGIVVPPENPQEFAKSLIFLANHPEELKKMGNASLILAKNEFSREHLSNEFASLIEEYA